MITSGLPESCLRVGVLLTPSNLKWTAFTCMSKWKELNVESVSAACIKSHAASTHGVECKILVYLQVLLDSSSERNESAWKREIRSVEDIGWRRLLPPSSPHDGCRYVCPIQMPIHSDNPRADFYPCFRLKNMKKSSL